MMTDEDSLRRFLLANGAAAERVERALAVLAPYFGIAASGRYALDRASTADVGGIACALWSAGRFHVKGCVFVPTCIRHDSLPWNEAAERTDLALALRDACESALAGGPFAGSAYALAFDKAVGDALKGALIATAGKDNAVIAKRQPQRLVVSVLQAYVAARAAGSPRADQLEPLAQMLARYIPVVEAGRRDGTWYVLAG